MPICHFMLLNLICCITINYITEETYVRTPIFTISLLALLFTNIGMVLSTLLVLEKTLLIRCLYLQFIQFKLCTFSNIFSYNQKGNSNVF